jgi:Glycosyl transferase family 2
MINHGMNGQTQYSLAVCFTVWNRCDLFRASYASLLRQLDGIETAIWIFDNGSDEPTRRFIEGLSSAEHRLFKVFLPQNMGIPFVVNLFSQVLTQDCDYAGYRAPAHVMLADADAYFKKPVREMIEILEGYELGIVSGHDSVEHGSTRQLAHPAPDGTTIVNLKSIERGLCLIMRKETLAACVPLPHDTNMNVDWELMHWHPSSVSACERRVGAVDYVAHIGLYDSTWHSTGVPANRTEVAEINQILEREGLLSAERRARMERFCQEGLQPEYKRQFTPVDGRRW